MPRIARQQKSITGGEGFNESTKGGVGKARNGYEEIVRRIEVEGSTFEGDRKCSKENGK